MNFPHALTQEASVAGVLIFFPQYKAREVVRAEIS